MQIESSLHQIMLDDVDQPGGVVYFVINSQTGRFSERKICTRHEICVSTLSVTLVRNFLLPGIFQQDTLTNVVRFPYKVLNTSARF